MTGREIRVWAWDSVKGRRVELIPALLLTMVPFVVQNILLRINPGLGWTSYLFSLVNVFLQMGYRYMAVGLVDGKRRGIRDLLFLLNRDRITAGFTAGLVLVAVPVLLNLPLARLWPVPGEPMELAGYLMVQLLLSVVCRVLLMPLSTALAVGWEGYPLRLVKVSLGMGVERFGPLLCFYLCTSGVLLLSNGSIFVMAWIQPELLILVTLAVMVFVLWFTPYVETAKALFVRELFFPGQRWESRVEQERSVRFMRQYAGGGGWYWCPMDRGPVWTKIPVCRRSGKKG